MNRTQTLITLGENFGQITKSVKLHRGSEAVCITPALDHVIMIIGKERQANVKYISQLLSVSSGAATQHIEALEKQGLVLRNVNPDDKRETFVTLTEAGSELLSKIMQKHTDILTEIFDHLDDDELEQLASMIAKITTKYS